MFFLWFNHYWVRYLPLQPIILSGSFIFSSILLVDGGFLPSPPPLFVVRPDKKNLLYVFPMKLNCKKNKAKIQHYLYADAGVFVGSFLGPSEQGLLGGQVLLPNHNVGYLKKKKIIKIKKFSLKKTFIKKAVLTEKSKRSMKIYLNWNTILIHFFFRGGGGWIKKQKI